MSQSSRPPGDLLFIQVHEPLVLHQDFATHNRSVDPGLRQTENEVPRETALVHFGGGKIIHAEGIIETSFIKLRVAGPG